MASGTDYLKLHFIVFLWGFFAILGSFRLFQHQALAGRNNT